MIELSLPAASNFQIDAASRHGEVESDFSGPALKVLNVGDNPSISGSVGKGGPAIKLVTEYGAVRLLNGGAHVPAPPKPPSLPRPPGAEEKHASNAPPHRRFLSRAADRRLTFMPFE